MRWKGGDAGEDHGAPAAGDAGHEADPVSGGRGPGVPEAGRGGIAGAATTMEAAP